MSTELQNKWSQCLAIIRDNVSEAIFNTWFADIKAIKYEGNTLTIQVKSNFVYEFLEENAVDLLGYTLNKVMGEGTRLMYSVLTDKENDLSMEVEPEGSHVSTKEEELDSMLISRYTFDNYVEGISNRLSRSVAVSVANLPGRTFNPLFIHGASGVGKT
ncbi:MAG: chromosomal replication initiator protein DnaA, partial [Bacteroidaceae bacterium]|nr:chromosomal replication initiator protein DnaA [Bacteroidaceae bacterium]